MMKIQLFWQSISHADQLIPPSSSQNHSRTYFWVCGNWETDHPKVGFSSSFSFTLD